MFGSFITDKLNPNDCDMFVVTSLTPYNEEWRDFIEWVDNIKKEFLERYHLPLNIIINTEKEFTDSSEFKVRILNKKIRYVINNE